MQEKRDLHRIQEPSRSFRRSTYTCRDSSDADLSIAPLRARTADTTVICGFPALSSSIAVDRAITSKLKMLDMRFEGCIAARRMLVYRITKRERRSCHEQKTIRVQTDADDVIIAAGLPDNSLDGRSWLPSIRF